MWPTLMKHHPRKPLLVLDARGFAILAAIAARMVDAPGADPIEIAHGVDVVIARESHEAQADFRQLLLLFDSALAGLMDAHVRPFTSLSFDEQGSVLYAWRDSRLALRQSGYKALRNLTAAAHYASPTCWESVGYPGPPKISGMVATPAATP